MKITTIFNIEIALEAARKLGFNVAGGSDENSIWLGSYYMPPGDHRFSHRQYSDRIDALTSPISLNIPVCLCEPNIFQIVFLKNIS